MTEGRKESNQTKKNKGRDRALSCLYKMTVFFHTCTQSVIYIQICHCLRDTKLINMGVC